MSTEPTRRGRPRKNPDQLAVWTPPPGWTRLVAWVGPEEKQALRAVADRAGVPVAELIRSLAAGLVHDVVAVEELLTQVRRGSAVMEKIPTIFDRGEGFAVVDKPRDGCGWVFAGEGVATEKLDGTNVRLTVRSGTLVRLEKRRNPSKAQKAAGIVDGWYVDTDAGSAEDRWIREAAENTDVTGWPDGEHSVEALGPRIQGNPLGLDRHVCVPFNLQVPMFPDAPRTFAELGAWLAGLESRFAPGHLAEGVVFHHADGRRAKIKRKDYARQGR